MEAEWWKVYGMLFSAAFKRSGSEDNRFAFHWRALTQVNRHLYEARLHLSTVRGRGILWWQLQRAILLHHWEISVLNDVLKQILHIFWCFVYAVAGGLRPEQARFTHCANQTMAVTLSVRMRWRNKLCPQNSFCFQRNPLACFQKKTFPQMEFLFGVILVTEVISALNCVCVCAEAAFKKHMRRTGLEIFVCFDLLCFCQLNWIVLNFFGIFLIRFYLNVIGLFFSLTVLCFFCFVLLKVLFCCGTTWCNFGSGYWTAGETLFAEHDCFLPLAVCTHVPFSDFRNNFGIKRGKKPSLLIFFWFFFHCLGFYKRAENRFWPAVAWTVWLFMSRHAAG